MYYLPYKNRKYFENPIGTLHENFEDILGIITGRTVYTVGDVVTHNALVNNVIPAVCIINGILKNGKCGALNTTNMLTFNVGNEAGTINDDLIIAIGNANLMKPSMVIINGDENLALLPLASIAEDNSIILYGQPNRGVVVCTVNREFRCKIVGLWNFLECDQCEEIDEVIEEN